MKKKRASEIFGSVDPHLKVIPARRKSHRLTNEDWEKTGGIYCSSCHQETVRLLEGLCPQCQQDLENERARIAEDKAEKRYYKDQLRKGTISLAQMREGRL